MNKFSIELGKIELCGRVCEEKSSDVGAYLYISGLEGFELE